ncbi:TPA: hypothetical protein ACH3X1_004128 [Trebouxia sp. C0004]
MQRAVGFADTVGHICHACKEQTTRRIQKQQSGRLYKSFRWQTSGHVAAITLPMICTAHGHQLHLVTALPADA